MQVQSINNQNKNIGFNGLYKFPAANDFSRTTRDLVVNYRCPVIYPKHLISRSGYGYILTPDVKDIETSFEEAFLKNFGKYWKVNITELLNTAIGKKSFAKGPEKAFLEYKGQYWKTGITELLSIDTTICDKFFALRKALDNGQEKWVEGKIEKEVVNWDLIL